MAAPVRDAVGEESVAGGAHGGGGGGGGGGVGIIVRVRNIKLPFFKFFGNAEKRNQSNLKVTNVKQTEKNQDKHCPAPTLRTITTPTLADQWLALHLIKYH